MNKFNPQNLLGKLDNLGNATVGIDSELRLIEILEPLLESEGYTIQHTGMSSFDKGIDILATKSTNTNAELPNKIGVQYKHTRNPVGTNIVQKMLGVSIVNNLDRLILLSRAGFTKEAWFTTKHNFPTSIELQDLNALRAWILRVERNIKNDYSKVVQAITDLSKRLARIIADNPDELINVEWRDLERILASVFEGLGFAVELTPSSKDGGKDIILEFSISGINHSYLVEVKHWRSKQKVGQGFISDFINVIANEKRQGGLYLATYGYSHDAFEALTEVEKSLFYAGSEQKIVSLCKTFVKAETGLWSAPSLLTDVIVRNTIHLET